MTDDICACGRQITEGMQKTFIVSQSIERINRHQHGSHLLVTAYITDTVQNGPYSVDEEMAIFTMGWF